MLPFQEAGLPICVVMGTENREQAGRPFYFLRNNDLGFIDRSSCCPLRWTLQGFPILAEKACIWVNSIPKYFYLIPKWLTWEQKGFTWVHPPHQPGPAGYRAWSITVNDIGLWNLPGAMILMSTYLPICKLLLGHGGFPGTKVLAWTDWSLGSVLLLAWCLVFIPCLV